MITDWIKIDIPTRRPDTIAIFSARTFVKVASYKAVSIFFPKKYGFFMKFCDFSKFNFFSREFNRLFFAKTPHLMWKRLFQKKIFWYTFYCKFANSTDFEKKSGFFQRKRFSKNPTVVHMREVLLLQSHSTASLLQFAYKKSWNLEPVHFARTIGKYIYQNVRFEWMIFLSFLNMADNDDIILTVMQIAEYEWTNQGLLYNDSQKYLYIYVK